MGRCAFETTNSELIEKGLWTVDRVSVERACDDRRAHPPCSAPTSVREASECAFVLELRKDVL